MIVQSMHGASHGRHQIGVGRSLGNVRIKNIGTNDAIGWSLAVRGSIMDDNRVYPPNDCAALRITIHYHFTHVIGSDQIAIAEIQLFGDGTHSIDRRWVQTSLLEAMIVMTDLQAVRWTIDGKVPEPEGNDHPTLVPMGCFRTADGFVNIAGPQGRLLRNFCKVIGLPDLPSDPRFDSTGKRNANRVRAVRETP